MQARKQQQTGTWQLPPVGTTTSSGIAGLDRIMNGGYTSCNATLVRGASGTGKTLFSLMFAANGAAEQDTIFASFDESVEHLENYLRDSPRRHRITFLDFTPDPDMTVSGAGEVDLGGVLVRVKHAMEKSGARHLVLDAFDTLFATYRDPSRVRQELYKVFAWCRREGVTLLATVGTHGQYEASTDVMDYASDCTILLTQNLQGGLMTRMLRVLKLRGRSHGTNEYPFLIDNRGISVLPVTDTAMSDEVYRKRLGTGNRELDKMLGGKGVWLGSTVLISGQSGTGKSIISANMAAHACAQGHKVLYASFEESAGHFMRDVKSAGVDLKPHVDAGRCRIISRRPVEEGMEMHVILLLRDIEEIQPDLLFIDPIIALLDLADSRTFKNMVLRLTHAIKNQGITLVMTELLPDDAGDHSSMNISSIIDTWIRLSRREEGDVMQRLIKVHKSRGAATSDRVHGFSISRDGISIE